MCQCSVTVISHRYCGKVLPLPDKQPRADGRRTEGNVTRCAHPAWLKGEEYPSTVNVKDGSWLETHARELDPKVPHSWHPGVVAALFGLDLSHLDQLRDQLKKASATPGGLAVTVPFTLDVMANTATIAGQPGALAINNGRADAAQHYPRVSHQVDSARRALQYVITVLQSPERPTKVGYLRLAHLVDSSRRLLEDALKGLHSPPAGSTGLLAHASPLPRGEPV